MYTRESRHLAISTKVRPWSPPPFTLAQHSLTLTRDCLAECLQQEAQDQAPCKISDVPLHPLMRWQTFPSYFAVLPPQTFVQVLHRRLLVREPDLKYTIAAKCELLQHKPDLNSVRKKGLGARYDFQPVGAFQPKFRIIAEFNVHVAKPVLE